MTGNNSSPLTHFLLSALTAFILVGLSVQNKTAFISLPVNLLLTPVRQPFFFARSFVDAQAKFIHNLPHQQRVIDDLNRQNAQLSLLAQKTNELEKENASLKSLLAANITPHHQVVSVKVIGLSRFATINQGSNLGLSPSMPVVIDDTIVGIISKVSPNTAQVQLLTDPDVSIQASTLNQASGTLIFDHNTLQLTQVPQKNTLHEEEPIFTTGSENIPSGLLIGKIKQINSSDTNVYQTATIEPAIKISQHQNLFVILD